MNCKSKSYHKIYLITILLIAAVIFSGCTLLSQPTPTAEWTAPTVEETATPQEEDTAIPDGQTEQTSSFNPLVIKYETGQSYISLPDGSEIYLMTTDTEIELSKLAGLTSGASENEILIRHGQILVVSHLPEGKWFTVISPDGYIARVTGSIMVVGYNAETGKYITDCVEGDCELGSDAQTLFQLAAEDQGWLDGDGNFQGPFEVDMDELREEYGEDVIPTEIPPTATTEPPTSTPDLDATATVSCKDFEEENPGTPCP